MLPVRGNCPQKHPKARRQPVAGFGSMGAATGRKAMAFSSFFSRPRQGPGGLWRQYTTEPCPPPPPFRGEKWGIGRGFCPAWPEGVFRGFVGVLGDFIKNRPNRGPQGSLFRKGRGVRHCAQREARPGAGRGVWGWFQGWGAAYSSSTSRLTRSIWRRRSTLWVRKPVSRPRETAWSMRVFSPSWVRAGRSSYRSCPT